MTYLANPDLAVGAGNKQRWNQAAHRRHGFHNAHRMFRRSLSLRAPAYLPLTDAPDDTLAAHPATQALVARPELSALICVQGERILQSQHAADFPQDQPHSIQSLSKLLMHLIVGRLMAAGRLDPARPVEHYLPEIGSGYRGATLQMVLDMDVMNDFSEDYTDPNAACFDEEIAMGWRLPRDGGAQTTLLELVCSIRSDAVQNTSPHTNYLSANTDLLTLITDRVTQGSLPQMLEDIVAQAGLAQALHVSLSTEGLPTVSGGGCLTSADLARFGLLLARQGGFTRASLSRASKTLPPPRDTVRYSNHLMTNGQWLGHAGYGGQFLMVDPDANIACAFLSVLENEAGYCIDYMAETITLMEQVVAQAAKP